ncbi:MAG: calsyntenin family protein, partial [SAR324 cluster bacterium]|nr:calsyntenin family protein [SAR324 cluster bacterium]
MKGYQETDDGMLLVTICENDVPGYSSCNYMNEGSTSLSFELIPYAYSLPIICDGDFCINAGPPDNVSPTASVEYIDSQGLNYPGPYREGGDNLTLKITFSEAMDSIPTMNLSGAISSSGVVLVPDNDSETVFHHELMIPSGDGAVDINLEGADLAGNPVVSSPTSGDNFTLDNTPPTGTLSVSSSSGAEEGYASTSNVSIQFSAQDSFGVSHYLTLEDNASVPEISDFVETSAPSSIDLVKGDGFKTIYGWVLDSTGNIGGPFTDNITLDTLSPQLSIESSPEAFTNKTSLSVSINLDHPSEVDLLGSCGTKTFLNKSSGSIELGNLAEGTYSDCRLEAFDLAGNTSGIRSLSQFTVDRTDPSSTSMVLDGGSSQTEMENITIELVAEDPSGISQYCVLETLSSGVPADNDACWKLIDHEKSFSQNESLTLSSGFSSKTVRAWFKDRAGNLATSSSSIERIDPNKPPIIGNGNILTYSIYENVVSGTSVGIVSVNDPDGDSITLTLSGTDSTLFNLSQIGVLTVAPGAVIDFETKSQLHLSVSASDGKLSASQSITINVTDLPEPSGEHALNFDGIDDWIQLPKALSIGSSSNTVEMWVKVPVVGEGDLTSGERVGILLGNYSSTPNSNWEINQGEVRIWWNNGQIDARGTTDLKDNKWHHLSFVRDTSQNKF